MDKKSTERVTLSIPTWQDLESCLRVRMRGWLTNMLKAEVDELLGRAKSERRKAVDPAPGYRNGDGKPRKLTLSNGTVTLRLPRIRGLEKRVESRLLPLFVRRTSAVNDLLPEVYLHGPARGDFDLALRGLLGEDAPISANTVTCLKEEWSPEWEEWSTRRLDELDVVYLWVDGIYVKDGFEKEKAVVLAVMAALNDGSKVIVALKAEYWESKEASVEILRDLKRRGMNCPRLVVGDGNLGIWSALEEVYPQAKEHRCWNHRIVNAVDKCRGSTRPRRSSTCARSRMRRPRRRRRGCWTGTGTE